MGRGKPFQCEITVSTGVEEKLFKKHNIEIWEIEEVIYDDPYALSISYRDCYFIYGRTFSGRYLLVLVRILSLKEIKYGWHFSKIASCRVTVNIPSLSVYPYISLYDSFQ